MLVSLYPESDVDADEGSSSRKECDECRDHMELDGLWRLLSCKEAVSGVRETGRGFTDAYAALPSVRRRFSLTDSTSLSSIARNRICTRHTSV